MIIDKIHALWPEPQGFIVEHDSNEDYYVFLHFMSNVKLKNGDLVRPGACIIYKPFSYRYFCAESEPLIHDWFHAYGDFEKIADKYGLKFNQFYYPGNDEEISEIIQQLELENLIKANFCDDICRLKIEELFAKIARGSNSPLPFNTETYERFLKLRSYIQVKYNEIRNIELLAHDVGLCPSRFYVLYKKIFGLSPKQDLINIRLEHAKQLLRQRQYSVSEIAEIVGYTNQYHFIRQFKLQTGLSPLQFSKSINK